jgi:hypothetical protein
MQRLALVAAAVGIIASQRSLEATATTAPAALQHAKERSAVSKKHGEPNPTPGHVPELILNADAVAAARLRFHPPPVLYSLPGSGNTWTRFLVDTTLGLPSGSYYNDIGLHRSFFPGEMTCQENMSVIKAHPNNFPYDHVFLRNSSLFPKKCMKGGIQYFDSTILLVREPLRSIWAEYQRMRMQNPHNHNSHTSLIPLSSFNRSHFERFSLDYAARVVREAFEDTYAQVMRAIPEPRRILVHYEDLQNHTTQRKALRKILEFLSDATFSDDRLCETFTSSEKLHRSRKGETASRDLATPYEAVFTPKFAEEVWAVLGDALKYFGYPNPHSKHEP